MWPHGPTRVRVYQPDGQQFLGLGWLLTRRRDHPRIRLDTGRVVLGCQCWWISDRVASSVEAQCAGV